MRIVSAPRLPDEATSPPPLARMLDSVRNLAERFPHACLREVPVVRAADLDGRANPTGRTRVWLALESLQVTGSFKVRGALAALGSLRERMRARGETGRGRLVVASAGNHGAGIAYAASILDLDATVVVPRSAPLAKRARIEAYGAEIVLVPSDHYDDAEAAAKTLARDGGCAFVSPYDDVDVVLGNGGSLGFEIVRALGGVPEIVIAPFGGGGLATGLGWALDHAEEPAARPSRVWGVQSEASPAMALSLERGTAVERWVTEGETLAEGLEGGISASAFARARAVVAGVLVVTEDDIAEAMLHAHGEMGLVLEGSAAAALVPILRGLPGAMRGSDEKSVDLVAVLTGRNVDAERLARLTAGAPSRTNLLRARPGG